jgi:hypothetical protein
VSAHSPGPWRFRRSGDLWWAIDGPAEGRFTPIVAWISHVESEADGRLMAASPDLLAALNEAVDLFAVDFEGGLAGTSDNVGGAWLRQARAAIAKATGTEEQTDD